MLRLHLTKNREGKYIHKKHPLQLWKTNQEILRSGCRLEDYL